MAFTYTELTAAERTGMLQQRLRAYEQEHFGHELNKTALTSQPTSPDKTAAIEAADTAQATLEAAITDCRAELDAAIGGASS